MLEFTGERVVPGQVDADLWNEHFSRYRFAAQFAHAKRVADLGCGTGYGAAELATSAAHVAGFDISQEAVDWAAQTYKHPNLDFRQGSCEDVPAEPGSVDLVVAFEVIEHLERPDRLLEEARRILTPQGQFLVSTPNRIYYSATRKEAGPNPFHHREYSHPEFAELLLSYFRHVEIRVQNHVPAFSFSPLRPDPSELGVAESGQNADPDSAHFFVAICSRQPIAPTGTFVYVPSSSNVLQERELHIERLQGELRQKDSWLQGTLAEHAALVEAHRKLTAELEASNQWARSRDAEVERAAAVVRDLQQESAATAEQLNTIWAERTQLADDKQRLETQLNAARHSIDAARLSRWLRLGRRLNLGPDL